ncbi:MAG: hypothetical protein AABY32_01710 [Nanoarchaeota archaeon]
MGINDLIVKWKEDIESIKEDIEGEVGEQTSSFHYERYAKLELLEKHVRELEYVKKNM